MHIFVWIKDIPIKNSITLRIKLQFKRVVFLELCICYKKFSSLIYSWL